MSRVLDELRLQVELEGFVPGTPLYERNLRARQVEKCQEMRGVASCAACPFSEECELVRAHLRDKVFPHGEGR